VYWNLTLPPSEEMIKRGLGTLPQDTEDEDEEDRF